jgi:hypothetical protein
MLLLLAGEKERERATAAPVRPMYIYTAHLPTHVFVSSEGLAAVYTYI